MKIKSLVICLSLLLLLGACNAQTLSAPQKSADSVGSEAVAAVKLSSEEAYARMQSGDPIIILDVRTGDEYAAGHIPNAILLPIEEIGDTPPAVLPVKDAEILIYCRSGNRSAQAQKKLIDMGYTRAFDFGGINEWPYETESGSYSSEQKSGTLSSFRSFDLYGQPVDESIFSAYDLTMINIWATFCGPCIQEMPALGKLASEYAGEGLRIVGLAADVSREADGTFSAKMLNTARALVAETGADYLHLLPSDDLVKAKLSAVSAVPETIFVDSEGRPVGQSYIGSRSQDDWREIIDELLLEVRS